MCKRLHNVANLMIVRYNESTGDFMEFDLIRLKNKLDTLNMQICYLRLGEKSGLYFCSTKSRIDI